MTRVAILVVIACALACAQDGPAFNVRQEHPGKPQKYPETRADEIYWASCHEVAYKLRPDRPAAVTPHPKITLVLGSKEKSIDVVLVKGEDESHAKVVRMEFVISLPEWKKPEDEVFFSSAVMTAGMLSLNSMDDLAKMAHSAIATADSKVSVQELLEKK